MAAIPYMPFYVADYLADAAHLSTLGHGAYLLLIMNYWQRGEPLPAADRKLARIVGLSESEWMEIRDDLAEFFQCSANCWTHKRIEAELAHVRAKSTKARDAGKASAKKRSSNERSTGVEQTLNGRSTDVERTMNHADTDTDTDTKKNDLLRKSCPVAPDAAAVIDHLNHRIGSKFQKSKASLAPINGRLGEGFTLDDLCAVVDFKASEWEHDPERRQYLRPETLFRPAKFPGYLNAARAGPSQYSSTTHQNIESLREWANGK